MRIRTATAQDQGRIAQLFAQLGYPAAGDGLERRLAAALDDAAQVVLVGEEGGAVAGVVVMHVFAPLHVERAWAVISALVVDAEMRSHGLGAALLAGAEAQALQRGCAHIELSSNEARTRAHAFYAAQGFVEVRKRMKKQLPAGTGPS